MKREDLAWFVIIGILLLIGFFIGSALDVPQSNEDDTFRVWFWERRSLDLITQAALILAGALGVSAVLPTHREERDNSDTQVTD